MSDHGKIIRAQGGCGHVFMDDGREVVCIQARPCPDHEDRPPGPARGILLGLAIMLPFWALALWWWLT